MQDRLVTASIDRWEGDGSAPKGDRVAVEEPIEIRLGGKALAVIMRTPGNDFELAAGFLTTEGIVGDLSQVGGMAYCEDEADPELRNIIEVYPAEGVKIIPEGWQRHFFASSSCGLCGKGSIDAIKVLAPPLEDPSIFPLEAIYRLPERLREGQAIFEETGGLHAAGLFNRDGELLAVREDIGRHNAVDKVIGWAFLERRLPLSGHLLMVSGRASFEILQKALVARIPFVAAVSAPSSLAVDLAKESRMTLVGFLRGQTFNAYSHPERIKGTDTP